MRLPRPRRRTTGLAGVILLASALAAPVLAATPTLTAPASGASVKLVLPAGFANGDLDLKWSVDYSDCPGPDSIHNSRPEYRVAGGVWVPARGGPYLGPGPFTAPANLFPKPTALRVEWRVWWDCGATNMFAGARAYSPVVAFTLLPVSSTPAKPTSPCAKLKGPRRTQCLAKQKRDAQLRHCKTLKAKKQRSACAKRARDGYAKAIRRS
jgi:hypothetical protein